MATRFYCPASAPVSGLTPSYDSGWNFTSEATRHELARAKTNSALTVGTRVGAWTATAGQKALDRQLFSPPLGAQTISGTVSIMMSSREYATSDNVDRPMVAIKVINSSGSVVATLLSLSTPTGASTAEMSATAQTSCTFANAATLSSYSCSAGDRIIVEIGFSNSTAGTSPEASNTYGDPTSGTDATLGTNSGTNVTPWIEFSANLTFASPTITSVSPSSGAQTGGTAITITGTGFMPGATVTVDGNSATSVVYVNQTTLTCVTPSGGSTGAKNVVVTNTDSLTGTSTGGYTYVPPAPPLAVLTTRLKRFYHGFSNASRTWSDDISGANATAASANVTPAEHTLSSGYVIPNFDGNATGSLADYLTGPALSGLATYNNTGYYLWFALMKVDALGADGESIVMRTYGALPSQIYVNNSGYIEVLSGTGTAALSDSVIAGDGLTHTVIVQGNAATGALQLWIDGVLQATAGTGSDWGAEWKATEQEIGARGNGTGDYRYDGLMAAMGFAFDASSFSGDIADLHDALVEYDEGSAPPAGAISGTTTLGLTTSATLTAKGTLSGSATLGLTATGTMAAGGVSGTTTLGLTASGTLTGKSALSGSTTLGLTASGTCLRFETVGLILGTRTKRHFGSLASASQWSDNLGAANAVQATSARQPTTSTLPDGFPSVSFSPGGSFSTNADFYSVAPAGASATPRYTLMCGVIQVDPSFGYNAGEGVAAFNIGAAAQLYIFPAIDFALRLAGWGAQSFAWDGTAINDGLPHTWIAVFDSTDHTCSLWVDGTNDNNTQVLSPTGAIDLSAETILIGAGNTSGQGPFEGILSDVAIAQDSSSFAGDIAALHAALSAHFVSGSITGTTALGLTASGTIQATGSILGSTGIGFTASGNIAGKGILEGSTTLEYTSSGTLTGKGILQGSATLELLSSGTVTGAGSVSASTTLGLTSSATIQATGSLSGSATLGLTASGDIENAGSTGDLEGTTTLGLTSNGTLTATGALSGTVPASLTASATIGGKGALQGSTTIGLTASGTVTAKGTLQGSTTAGLSASATLTAKGALAGSTSFGLTASASTDGFVNVSGSTSLGFTSSGTLTAKAALQAAATSVGLTATGTLKGAGVLQASGTLGLTASATLRGLVNVSGSTSFELSTSATIKGRGDVLGSTSFNLTTVGTLTALGSLSGTTTIGLSATAAFEASAALQGLATINLSAIGVLTDGIPIVVPALALQARIQNGLKLTGRIQKLKLSGRLQEGIRLRGTVR